MVFRLGLCRKGMGAVWEMRFVARDKSPSRFLTAEPFGMTSLKIRRSQVVENRWKSCDPSGLTVAAQDA
jgi:hypothetical protein